MSDQPTTRARTAPQISSFADLQELSKSFDGDGRMRTTCEPQDAQHDNTRWAGIASFTLAQFGIRSGEWQPGRRTSGDSVELAGLMRDMLTALRHLADAVDEDFDQLVHRSYGAYRDDVLGQD